MAPHSVYDLIIPEGSVGNTKRRVDGPNEDRRETALRPPVFKRAA